MGFDPLSFIVGFGGGVGVSYGAYRYREQIGALRDSALDTIENVRDNLSRSADSRYTSELIQYLQQQHIAKDFAPLSEVLVEPRLLVLPPPPRELEDPNAAPENYDYVVPRIYDQPQLLSAYYVENLPLSDITAGDNHVAILGVAGAGKSTALVTLGLMALGVIKYSTLQELTNQAIDEAYAELPENERQKRLNEMNAIQKRVIEQLRGVQDITDLQGDVAYNIPPDITNFFPIYVHAADVDLSINVFGLRVDPAEPLIRAFQRYASLITAQSAPPLMYQQLSRGQCLILIDGLEDLPQNEQKRLYGWLESLIEYYGHNRIVITGPATGFDSLVALGFVPTFVKPFSMNDAIALVEKWADAWPAAQQRLAKRRIKEDELQTISQGERQRLLADTLHRRPFHLVLKTLAHLQGEVALPNERGWYERFLRNYLPENEHVGPILREVATLMLDRDIILKDGQILEISTQRLTPNPDEPPLEDVDKFTKTLLNSGLFVKRGDNYYDFLHPLFRSYFGAEAIIHDMNSSRITELGGKPNWHHALRLAADGVDITGAVGQKLNGPTDVLLSNLFQIADWIPNAPVEAIWRTEIMKRFGAALLAPSQYDTIRERALAALIASRDPNLENVFRQAVRSGNPAIRKYGCLGLGAIQAEAAINDLRPMLVDDNRDVQVAAAMALGAISTESAIDVMIQGLLEGSEGLRQVIALALANVQGLGHNVLREASQHNDMMVRRAAAFGLARVQANWSLIALYDMLISEKEWYVRSAAERLFAIARSPEREGPRHFPRPEELPWFQVWVSNIGHEKMPEGEEAVELLLQVLRDPRPLARIMAIKTIGRLGLVKGIRPLYVMLMDKEARVRTTAYDALGSLQIRLNEPLPAVI
ncbi:MAG: hypothetical protein CUN55_02480 [Phototrophicales bacterium]|nr:MAG: hypothetical protein CUN55_02480 [Phototrophicales bacterium]